MRITNPTAFLRTTLRRILSPVKILPADAAYSLWARTYDRQENNVVLFVEERAVCALLNDIELRDTSVVDIGCGTGRHIGHFLDRGAARVVGLDSSLEMLFQATAKFHTPKVLLAHASMERMPLRDGLFDLGIVSLALSHLPDIRPALREIARLLKPDGILVISDLHWSFNSRGWYRTFPTDNSRFRKYAVENFAHTADTYESAFHGAGLAVDRYTELNIDESVRTFFDRARMTDVFERYRGQPLLVVYKVHKV